MSELNLFITSFVVTLASTVALMRFAPRLGLLDHPDHRKQHEVPVPAVGGLALYFMFMSLFISGIATSNTTIYLILAATLITCVGVLDDRFKISPLWRLLVQFIAAAMLVFGADLRLEHIGPISWHSEYVHLGNFSEVLTIFGIVSVINAMNFIDGLDGLAGGIALIALVSLWVLFGLNGGSAPDLILALIGGIAAFMLFNARWFGRRKAAAFLGDAGSTLIGLLIAALMVEHSQGHHAVVSPVVVLWLLAIPLVDLVTTVVRRIVARRSPFTSDREHLHYRLSRFSKEESSSVRHIHNIAFICACIGVTAQMFNWPMNLLFYLFLFLLVATYFTLRRHSGHQTHTAPSVGYAVLDSYSPDKHLVLESALPDKETFGVTYWRSVETPLVEVEKEILEDYPDAK